MESGFSTASTPYQATFLFENTISPPFHPRSPELPRSYPNRPQHGRSLSANSMTSSEPDVEPELVSWV